MIVNELLVLGQHGLRDVSGPDPGRDRGADRTTARPSRKTTYLPKMIAGDWTGTMNLTEPHCGTDLGLLRTKAVKQADGSYKITGTKIFISAGEHDLAENIVHLVLARIEGAPDGIKGISLFVVPKFLVNADGSLGARNGVSCGSIEEKMGIHGNVHLRDELRRRHRLADRRGEPRPQRHVHDDERGAARRRRAGAGACPRSPTRTPRPTRKDRLQGRALTGAKFPDKPADPIIVHPDVRRMLMTHPRRSTRPRARWCCGPRCKADVAHRSDDEKARQAADDHMGLLTPVIKGVLTDHGFANTVLAQQMYRRPRLHRRARHGAVRARCAHRHDLRGRERHPGARSGRPQAAEGRRPRDAGVLRRGAGLHQGALGRRRR